MNAAAPATQNQLDYLVTLGQSRDLSAAPNLRTLLDALKRAPGTLTAAEAHVAIEVALKQPRIGGNDQPAAPGYYLVGADVFVVAPGRQGGRPYARKLLVVGNRGRWDYAPGMVYKLGSAKPLTIEEAAAMGRLHGCCVVCAKTLTDPKSVQAGIGPVCAKKLAF